nr:hypothetical protein [Tanacetum cinerariifolium]
MSSQFITSMLNPTPDAGIEYIVETTSQIDVQTPTSVAPLHVSAPTLTPSTIATITTTQQAPTPLTTASSTLLQDLPNFGSLFGYDHRLKTLEANFSEFTQTNQFARAVSSILRIVHRYMDQRMNEAVKVAVQLQSDRLRDEAQKENDEFLKTIDENMQKIIKELVKEQFKMEIKKILIEKMECNKSIHRSNEQRNLYKALVEAYESDKIILDTYEDTVTLKRRRDDDAGKNKEPSAGSDRGSKRHIEGKEPESASAPKKKATRSAGKSTQGYKSQQKSVSESAIAEEPMQTTFEMEEPSHPEFETGADDKLIVEPSQHPECAPKEKTTKKTGKSTEGFKSHHKSASEFAPTEEPMRTTKDLEVPAHQEFNTGATDDQPVEEASKHPDWFQKQTNQFAEAISSILGIVDKYLDHRMNEAVNVAVQLQSDRLRDEAQVENENFLNKLDENIQKIIKEQVKAQVSKILPKTEKTVNEQLEAEVLTRSSNSFKTSHAIATNLSELELKKILIKKRESNNAPKEKTTKKTGKSTEGFKTHHKSASEFAPTEEPMRTTKDLEVPAHQEFDTGATDDQHVEEASKHPDWFQKQVKPPTP